MKPSIRISLWVSLAAASAAVAVLTTVSPHWLESVFGVDLDGGDGSAEWLIVAVSAAVALLSVVRAAGGLARIRRASAGRA